MPVYEYEHIEKPCEKGKVIEVKQSLSDAPLSRCPQCNKPVRRIMSAPFISAPKSNGELRDLGFTKLVKRDDGVYENVTRRKGDSRFMERNKPETIPDLSKTISQ